MSWDHVSCDLLLSERSSSELYSAPTSSKLPDGEIITMQSGSRCPDSISRAMSKLVNINKHDSLLLHSKTHRNHQNRINLPPHCSRQVSLLWRNSFHRLSIKNSSKRQRSGLASCSSQQHHNALVNQWGHLVFAATRLLSHWAQTKTN